MIWNLESECFSLILWVPMLGALKLRLSLNLVCSPERVLVKFSKSSRLPVMVSMDSALASRDS